MVFMLYKDEKLNLIQIYEKLQIIYSAALTELVRQISIENNERALLLEKIWQAYATVFSKAVNEINKEKKREAKDNLLEINRVHKMYSQEMKTLNELLQKSEKEKQDIID